MEMGMWVSANPIRSTALPSPSSWSNSRPAFTQRITCRASALPSQQEVKGAGILCDPCKGKGWVVCDFCEGQKINVQAQSKRFYRRCPSCRAVLSRSRVHAVRFQLQHISKGPPFESEWISDMPTVQSL